MSKEGNGLHSCEHSRNYIIHSNYWIHDQEIASSTHAWSAHKQLWATCSHLCACVGAHNLVVSVDGSIFITSHSQVPNLISAQVHSASSPQQDGIVYELQGKDLMRLIRVVVCLPAATWSNCLLMQAMDDCIVHCGIISSCQSAATSDIVRNFWLQVRLL